MMSTTKKETNDNKEGLKVDHDDDDDDNKEEDVQPVIVVDAVPVSTIPSIDVDDIENMSITIENNEDAQNLQQRNRRPWWTTSHCMERKQIAWLLGMTSLALLTVVVTLVVVIIIGRSIVSKEGETIPEVSGPEEEEEEEEESSYSIPTMMIPNECDDDASRNNPIPLDTKIYFRSGGIEFWSIDIIDDINSIWSAHYIPSDNPVDDYAKGQSLVYELGDLTDSVVFEPFRSDEAQTMGTVFNIDYDWNEKVQNFVASGKTELNLIRLDIGGGDFTLKVNGRPEQLYYDDRNPAYIEANSILFVDSHFLPEPIYISRSVESMILDDEKAASVKQGVPEDVFELLETIHSNSNSVDSTSPLDVNGAVYIPLVEPLSIADFVDPNSPQQQQPTFNIRWPTLRDSLYICNAKYTMDAEAMFDLRISIATTNDN